MTPPSARLYLFDADGTLRRTTVEGQPCPHREDEWALMDGVRARLRALPPETRFGVASNQDHVGYGLVSEGEARALLRSMMLAATGRELPDEALQLCPHRLEEPCRCRKPGTAMIERVLAFWGMRASEALFVGDEESDREAAEAAGVRFEWADAFFRRG
jgi:D-glycero-D-manno-heptose 1,7-bisphosphate phosphatase